MADRNTEVAADDHYLSTGDSSGNQFLTFMLGGEYYGVDILQVQEIKAWTPVTKVPNMPETVKGVLNLRGEIVPILDLRVHFGLENLEYTPLTVIIVLSLSDDGVKHRTVGIVADSVSDVVDIDDKDMKPSPELGEDVDVEFIRNIATVDNKMVMLLDLMLLLHKTTLESAVDSAKKRSTDKD